jgi:nucleotide-binding universal stress UspA family protein
VKKILVLTDFSENAIAAEKYALQLAMQATADIILYNAYPHRARNISGNVVWPHDEPEPTFELQSISNLRSRVSELNHGLSKMSDTAYKPSIDFLENEGGLTDKLNVVMTENSIWLLVMGTKGESFARNVLFGSNVYKVLEEISQPVLIIPKNVEYKNLKEIAYATDLKSSDLKIIEWLYELAKTLEIKLSIVHVSSDIAADKEKGISKEQEKLYQEKFPGLSIQLYEGENVQDSLHKIAEQIDVSILALMHRKYGFFEILFHQSTSHKMVRHTEIPILIFPDFYKR